MPQRLSRTTLDGAQAQRATKARDDAYESFREEMRVFVGLARLALKNRPDLALEMTL